MARSHQALLVLDSATDKVNPVPLPTDHRHYRTPAKEDDFFLGYFKGSNTPQDQEKTPEDLVNMASRSSISSASGLAPDTDQAQLLVEAMRNVKAQNHAMNAAIDKEDIVDAIKQCSVMLEEMKTAALTPRNYYELYISIFDKLNALRLFFRSVHMSGQNHLADLYEMVQYQTTIIPRLYLMITIGAAYLSVPDNAVNDELVPVQDIMRDMMEMVKGVQHPTKGLFLRYYLMQCCKDSLNGVEDRPPPPLPYVIEFITENFTEMLKLWVRMQYQGLTRDRARTEGERQELKVLVGSNLVRMSTLDGVDLEVYREQILPNVLDQIISCRDVIAQEYLMDVVIQVFPDEYHLQTLGPFLHATSQLHPKVNVKHVMTTLIDRLASYANREAEYVEVDDDEYEPTSAVKKEDTARMNSTADHAEEADEADEVDVSQTEPLGGDHAAEEEAASEEANGEQEKEDYVEAIPVAKKGKKLVRRIRGIPEDVSLFNVFWDEVVALLGARPDLSIEDITAMLLSLSNLSLACYPVQTGLVDQTLDLTAQQLTKYAEGPRAADVASHQTLANIEQLLLNPIRSYTSILTLISLQNYDAVLKIQPLEMQRVIARAIMTSMLSKGIVLSDKHSISEVLRLCDCLIGGAADATKGPIDDDKPLATADLRLDEDEEEEQGMLARLIHLLRCEGPEMIELLETIQIRLEKGGQRIKYTYPSLLSSSIELITSLISSSNGDLASIESHLSHLARFNHTLIYNLHRKVPSTARLCHKLYLSAGLAASMCQQEDVAYELFVQAFTIYETSIAGIHVEASVQYDMLASMIGAVRRAQVFAGGDNYDALATKLVLYAIKLRNQQDRCRAVLGSAHLFWVDDEDFGADGEDEKQRTHFTGLQDGQRVVNCLQRAVKIADGVEHEMVCAALFVDVLAQFGWFFGRGCPEVTPTHLNGLLDLLNQNMSAITSTPTFAATQVYSTAASTLADFNTDTTRDDGQEGAEFKRQVERIYRETLADLSRRKREHAGSDKRWAEIEV